MVCYYPGRSDIPCQPVDAEMKSPGADRGAEALRAVRLLRPCLGLTLRFYHGFHPQCVSYGCWSELFFRSISSLSKHGLCFGVVCFIGRLLFFFNTQPSLPFCFFLIFVETPPFFVWYMFGI